MSTVAQFQASLAPNRFAYGFTRQTWWNWRIGTAFFFGEIGAGLFLVSLVKGHALGMLIGYLIVMAGKNTAHLSFLGKPQRFWRAAMRPDRSWIARGIWATGVFGIAGAALLAPYILGPAYLVTGPLHQVAYWAAAAAALFIMFYDGMVMKASRSIAAWNTFFLPVLCLTYALLGGATMAITLRALQHLSIPDELAKFEHLLLLVNLALLLIYVARTSQATAAARQTVRMLLSGPYAKWFVGVVLLVGLGATIVLSIIHERVPAEELVVAIAICELAGDFALVMLLLKSGFLAPQTQPKYARN